MFKLEKLPGDISVPKRLPSACFVRAMWGRNIVDDAKNMWCHVKKSPNTIVSVSVPVHTDHSVLSEVTSQVMQADICF